MKKVITGIIIGSIITASATALSAEIYLNQINITVDGKPVVAENILYNGRTYVQLRALSDVFKKDVAWNPTTNTANIGKVPTPIPTPTPIVPKLSFKATKVSSSITVRFLIEITNNTSIDLTYDGSKFICSHASNMLNGLSANSVKQEGLLTVGSVKPGETISGYALFMREADYSTNVWKLKYDGESIN